MRFLDRFVGAEPDHYCNECGTDRLPADDVRCWECELPAPEANAYQSEETGRPRLRVVPSTPPPADPVPAGFEAVDETLWSGHRFVLLRNLDTGGHRITVDGVEVWEAEDGDTDAAANEMARRMGSADVDDIEDLEAAEAVVPAAKSDSDETLETIDRRPILDDWQRSPRAALDRAGELLADVRYRALYRAVHPAQVVRAFLTLWTAGAWFLVVRWALFTFHADETARRIRDKSLKDSSGGRDKTDDRSGLTWDQTHRQAIYRRCGAQLVAIAVVAMAWTGAAIALWWNTEPRLWVWIWWSPGGRLVALCAVLVAVVPVLVGRKIRPADADPILKTPVSIHRVPDLRRNPGLILDGFENLGGSPTSRAYKRQRERGVPACTYREDLRTNGTGTGLICKVRTPEPASVMLKPSQAPNDVMAKALGRPTALVKLSHHQDDEADVVTVFVSRRPLRDMPTGIWPLLKRGSANYFEPITIGIDEYGEPVSVCLNERHALVGGMTGSGKSASGLRALLCGLALDPRVRLFTYWKGGADGTPFLQVAHRIEMGNTPAHIDRIVADLEALQATALRRQRFQENHPELFEEGAVTDATCNLVAADPVLAGELDEHVLYPIVIAMDECRFPLADERVAELLTWFALQARAVGISLIMATQKPAAASVPSEIKGQADLRICFRVDTSAARDAVLGNASGIDMVVMRSLPKGTSATRDPDYAERGSMLVKHYFMALPAAHEVLERAAAARRARGLLSGAADGEAPPDPSIDTILDHIAQLVPWGDRIHGDTLTELLGASFAQYSEGDIADRTKRVLGLLRDHGVKTQQIEMEIQHGEDTGIRRNRIGIRRPDFDAVYAAMIANREADTGADINPDTTPDIEIDWTDNTPDNWADEAPDTNPRGAPWENEGQ